MDREILFRGKRKDNDEWIYGYYHRLFECIFLKDKPLIIAESDFSELFGALKYHTVKDNTVGQYTGLTDKNGKRIFEGDILECALERFVVEWDSELAGFYLDDVYPEYQGCATLTDVAADGIIIGNIHDNPELIGGNENEWKLKPCPFCGSEKFEKAKDDNGFGEFIRCLNCFAQGPLADGMLNQSPDEEWNRRYLNFSD